MKTALWCILLALSAHAQPHRVFCPSASHYFNFSTSTPSDSVTWSQATIRLFNNATFSSQLNALSLQPPGGYAQFNWLEAGSTALAVVTWVYVDALQDGATIFSLGVGDSTSSPDTPKHTVYARTHATSVEVGHGVDGGEESATAELALVPHTWTHLAAVFAADGAIEVYVNGVLRAANRMASPVPYALRTSCYIGRSQHTGAVLFEGAVADFGMYYEPLSGTTISQLVAGNTSACADFQPSTTFSRLDIGQDASGTHFYEGEMFNFAVYNYDLLTVLFASTLAEASEVERTSSFWFVTIIASIVMACVAILVLVMGLAVSAKPRNSKGAPRKRPVSYKSGTLTM
jgi:hypothetical protein